MGHSHEALNEEDSSSLIVNDDTDFLHEGYQHKIEEKKLHTESENAFRIFENIKNDGKQFHTKVQERHPDIFDQYETDEDIEKNIKNRKDRYLFRIYRLSNELATSIERYVSIVDKFKAFELLIKSGLENKNTARDLQIADEARTKLHDKLIAYLNSLMVAYDNAGLDKSWRNDIKYDRFNIQVWAENVVKYLHSKNEEE